MMPGFQMGYLYREKLEKYDTLPDGPYLLLVMGIQLLITVLCGGLAFSAVWVSSFANGPVIPYLTVITGLAFWLRISRIIKDIPYLSGKLVTIGRNTYAVMMHHIFAFFLVKAFFYLIHILTPLCAEFDTEMFLSEINFIYLPGGTEASKWIYLLVGIGIPLLIANLQKAAGKLCQKRPGKLCQKRD